MCKIIILLIVLIILLLILLIQSKNEDKYFNNADEIIEYKITNKPKLNISDTFNIKEYDIINDNIVIHNKFKNELLDSKKNKQKYNEKLLKDKEQKKIEQNNIININANKIKIYELKKQHDLISKNVLSLKNNFKLDLNNFLNDYKQKLVSKNEIIKLIKKIEIEIDINLNRLKKIKLNYSDIDDIELINKYENVLLENDDILNKKKNIYFKIINS